METRCLAQVSNFREAHPAACEFPLFLGAKVVRKLGFPPAGLFKQHQTNPTRRGYCTRRNFELGRLRQYRPALPSQHEPLRAQREIRSSPHEDGMHSGRPQARREVEELLPFCLGLGERRSGNNTAHARNATESHPSLQAPPGPVISENFVHVTSVLWERGTVEKTPDWAFN